MQTLTDASSCNASLRWLAFVVLAATMLLTASRAQSASSPVCPTGVYEPNPPFAGIGESPSVSWWHDLDALPVECGISLQTSAELTVALAGRFTQPVSIEGIAARLGAISKTQGLKYWSVTDRGWRELVSEAFALESRDSQSVRPDFTGQEILSGQPLYFAQNDTRSWGLNIYSVKAISSSPEHLMFESQNVSPIRFGPITLFEPGDVQSVLYIDRSDDNTWTYFSLAVIKQSALDTSEKSLINRQAAFYRFLISQSSDQEAPLAP